jgi:hypothetical protein
MASIKAMLMDWTCFESFETSLTYPSPKEWMSQPML